MNSILIPISSISNSSVSINVQLKNNLNILNIILNSLNQNKKSNRIKETAINYFLYILIYWNTNKEIDRSDDENENYVKKSSSNSINFIEQAQDIYLNLITNYINDNTSHVRKIIRYIFLILFFNLSISKSIKNKLLLLIKNNTNNIKKLLNQDKNSLDFFFYYYLLNKQNFNFFNFFLNYINKRKKNDENQNSSHRMEISDDDNDDEKDDEKDDVLLYLYRHYFFKDFFDLNYMDKLLSKIDFHFNFEENFSSNSSKKIFSDFILTSNYAFLFNNNEVIALPSPSSYSSSLSNATTNPQSNHNISSINNPLSSTLPAQSSSTSTSNFDFYQDTNDSNAPKDDGITTRSGKRLSLGGAMRVSVTENKSGLNSGPRRVLIKPPSTPTRATSAPLPLSTNTTTPSNKLASTVGPSFSSPISSASNYSSTVSSSTFNLPANVSISSSITASASTASASSFIFCSKTLINLSNTNNIESHIKLLKIIDMRLVKKNKNISESLSDDLVLDIYYIILKFLNEDIGLENIKPKKQYEKRIPKDYEVEEIVNENEEIYEENYEELYEEILNNTKYSKEQEETYSETTKNWYKFEEIEREKEIKREKLRKKIIYKENLINQEKNLKNLKFYYCIKILKNLIKNNKILIKNYLTDLINLILNNFYNENILSVNKKIFLLLFNYIIKKYSAINLVDIFNDILLQNKEKSNIDLEKSINFMIYSTFYHLIFIDSFYFITFSSALYDSSLLSNYFINELDSIPVNSSSELLEDFFSDFLNEFLFYYKDFSSSLTSSSSSSSLLISFFKTSFNLLNILHLIILDYNRQDQKIIAKTLIKNIIKKLFSFNSQLVLNNFFLIYKNFKKNNMLNLLLFFYSILDQYHNILLHSAVWLEMKRDFDYYLNVNKNNLAQIEEQKLSFNDYKYLLIEWDKKKEEQFPNNNLQDIYESNPPTVPVLITDLDLDTPSLPAPPQSAVTNSNLIKQNMLISHSPSSASIYSHSSNFVSSPSPVLGKKLTSGSLTSVIQSPNVKISNKREDKEQENNEETYDDDYEVDAMEIDEKSEEKITTNQSLSSKSLDISPYLRRSISFSSISLPSPYSEYSFAMVTSYLKSSQDSKEFNITAKIIKNIITSNFVSSPFDPSSIYMRDLSLNILNCLIDSIFPFKNIEDINQISTKLEVKYFETSSIKLFYLLLFHIQNSLDYLQVS